MKGKFIVVLCTLTVFCVLLSCSKKGKTDEDTKEISSSAEVTNEMKMLEGTWIEKKGPLSRNAYIIKGNTYEFYNEVELEKPANIYSKGTFIANGVVIVFTPAQIMGGGISGLKELRWYNLNEIAQNIGANVEDTTQYLKREFLYIVENDSLTMLDKNQYTSYYEKQLEQNKK